MKESTKLELQTYAAIAITSVIVIGITKVAIWLVYEGF